MTSNITRTTSPFGNYVVHAAAGTGKTWLLTSRIIHLLLVGADPGSILAITFTRKAAAEIQERVSSRLLEMADYSDEELTHLLQEIGCESTPAIRDKARRLFEELLVTDQPLRVNTFHGFCQELLQRFPLESGLPPGFQLIESTVELQSRAWRAFEARVRLNSDSTLATSFNTLLGLTGSPSAAREALFAFLEHRSDWWAFTESSTDPVEFAQQYVDSALGTDADHGLAASDLQIALQDVLQRYAQLLGKHPTTTYQRYIELIERAINTNTPERAFLDTHNKVFLDSKGQRKHIKPNKTLDKKLGVEGAAELIRLHEQIADQLDTWRDHQKAKQNAERNHAWLHCGHALLEIFQGIKQELEVLDFADLEWQAYRLMSDSEHAQWVQYKLDQRIDHLLVDEFQDTNPTQWHLILPLLDEMAAGQAERHRSAFVVGDIKQSIYRFRRAAPDLFHHAREWLTVKMEAESASQKKSYRSSPAIIEFVNLLFGSTDEQNGDHFHLHDFSSHDTHHTERWGRVELLPLIERKKADLEEPETTIRNPLKQAQKRSGDATESQYKKEAEQIVDRIRELIGEPIDDGDQVRAIKYSDIMILVRSRTHTQTYEDALRHAGIPFTSTGKSQFLEAIEIRDLIHLLRALHSPFDDLALSSALRSPVFSCTNNDLQVLAKLPHKWWWHRLGALAGEMPPEHALSRAWELLNKWRQQIDKIPVHDLLDRIYADSNLVGRYFSATPKFLRHRIEANLNTFLEMALEADGGRYPSLAHFIESVQTLATDEITQSAQSTDNRIRIMTIHGAKGLESPVVFVADTARPSADPPRSFRTVVNWPADSEHPDQFLLVGKKSDRDQASEHLLDEQQAADRREEANLLYVALTRAGQYLYVSGCEPDRRGRAWYAFIEDRLLQQRANLETEPGDFSVEFADNDDEAIKQPTFMLSFGRPGEINAGLEVSASPEVELDKRLTQVIAATGVTPIINPSALEADHAGVGQTKSASAIERARQRGIWTHRALELLPDSDDQQHLYQNLKMESERDLAADDFDSCWQQAVEIVNSDLFKEYFDGSQFGIAHNELPILYQRDSSPVYGIIDRVVLTETEAIVIDYKTHENATAENIKLLAEPYTAQMQFYGDGVARLWPDKKVRLALLFTGCAGIVEVPYPAEA